MKKKKTSSDAGNCSAGNSNHNKSENVRKATFCGMDGQPDKHKQTLD